MDGGRSSGTAGIRRRSGVIAAALLVVVFAAAVTGALAPAASAAPDAYQLDAFLEQHDSPMAGSGATFIAQGEANGVSPVFLVALAGAESSFGLYLYSENGDQCTYNAFNWFYGATRPQSDFSSWDEAIARVAAGIAGELYYGAGLYSVDAIAPRYCPDGTASWIANVKAFMVDLGGDPADTRVAASGSVASPVPSPVPTGPGVVALDGSVKLDDGDRVVGQRIYAWFTLTNTGGEPIALEGIRLALRGPGDTDHDLVSDQPLTLEGGQVTQVSASWPLDLTGRWQGWIEVTQNGVPSLVGDEQAFAFWVKLPEDLRMRRWVLREAELVRLP